MIAQHRNQFTWYKCGDSNLFKINANLDSIYYYVFFSANLPFIFGGTLPFLAHYWSIGVEEQFYLLYPHLFKIKMEKIVTVLIIILIILLGLKLSALYLFKNNLLYTFLHVNRFQCMIVGAIGAYLCVKEHRLIRYFDNKLVQCFSWIIIGFVTLNYFHVASVIDNEIIAFVTLAIIIGQINKTNRIVNLENRYFNFIGIISYGIYVIHPIVIYLLATLIDWSLTDVWYKCYLVLFSVIAITIILSKLSYEFIEKPFLKLKDSFALIRSTNNNNN